MGYYYPNGEEEWDAKYSVSGEVKAEIQEFAGLKEVFLVEYDTSLGRTHQGYNSTKYVKHPMDSKELLDVLISVDIKNPEVVLRKKYLLENIEGLCELGYLVRENSELRVDIPVINTESYELLKSMMDSSKRELLEVLTPLGKLMCEKGYVKVPEHIKSVPKFYKYYPCMVSLPMTIVYEAVEKGMFLKGVNENVPAALIVIDK